MTRVTTKQILEATIDTIVTNGLTDWTVEMAASKAGCAKGLVLYHFGTKGALLNAVADRVRSDRGERRVAALAAAGARALDNLWAALEDEVNRGTAALWLGLVSNRATRAPGSTTAADRVRLAEAAATALGLPMADALEELADALNGFELALIQGRDTALVRESYDRYWLSLLSPEPT
ncbi:MAG TPA: TetR/AcrR family transcriptional regulator [Gemmatimonadales bacterium]